jgi:hypothetical protein
LAKQGWYADTHRRYWIPVGQFDNRAKALATAKTVDLSVYKVRVGSIGGGWYLVEKILKE